MNLLGSVTTLDLSGVILNENAIGNFEENLLRNIESVRLWNFKIMNASVGHFLVSCPKLKSLKVDDFSLAAGSILQRTYSTLEHFDYVTKYDEYDFDPDQPVPPLPALLKSFLERNPTIKSLRIDADYLLEIGLNASTVQLDFLTVAINGPAISAVELAIRLKTLHANGVYKKLQLSLQRFIIDKMFFNEMRSFSALEVLRTFAFNAKICHLTELKELHLFRLTKATQADLEAIAKNLTKLERLWIYGTVDQLSPFLRNSKALKMAIFCEYNDDSFCVPLNLFKLNKVRRMSGSQRKVSIGLYEKGYVATKWMTKNVNYELVEITRQETIRERFEYSNKKDLLV